MPTKLSYGFLSDDEIQHELELASKQFQRLRQQIERLTSLRAEGKVSDVVFREVLDDISNRFDAYSPKRDELKTALEGRTGRMKEETKQLRHDLESLEVRYTIGSVPEDQYKVNRATYIMRLQTIEEFTKVISSSLSSMDDDMEKISAVMSQYRQPRLREERVTRPVVSEVSEVKPIAESTATSTTTTRPAPTEAKKEPKIRICPRCGAENPETSLYCYNCGAKLA